MMRVIKAGKSMTQKVVVAIAEYAQNLYAQSGLHPPLLSESGLSDRAIRCWPLALASFVSRNEKNNT